MSSYRVDLSWAQNLSNNNVMVAWSTNAAFGTPSGSYVVGDSIPDGGTVLYNGSATHVSHSGLAATTTYYYMAWSVLAGPNYSIGVPASVTTPALPTITTTSPLPSAFAGVAYTLALAANGGVTPYTWSLVGGSLPLGLNLSIAGVISGTPDTATTATFTVQVTDNGGCSFTKDFSLTVNTAPPPRTIVINNSTVNYAGTFLVGTNDPGYGLIIANAGILTSSNGVVGNSVLASSNFALVMGAGLLWSNTFSMFVGSTGSFNQLTITNAGGVLSGIGYVGYNLAAGNNAVVVTGPGSFWGNSTNLYIGYNGSSNRLTIANGGLVRNSAGYVGDNNGASNNAATVIGTGSLWSNSGAISLGVISSSNQAAILYGGQIVAGGAITIGSGSVAYANTLLVSCTGCVASAGLTLGIGGSRSNSVSLQSNALWNLGGGRLVWGSGPGAFDNTLGLDATSALTNIFGLTFGDNNTTFYMTNSAGGFVLNGFTTNQLQFSNGFGGLTVGSGGSLHPNDLRAHAGGNNKAKSHIVKRNILLFSALGFRP